MNAFAPPRKRRALCGSALRNTELIRAYRLLTFLQTPFGFVFWKIEQVKGQLQDRFDNERSET
jgi:hypothetical protein